MIWENLSCFGPKRCGPNLLINKFMRKENSIIQRFLNLSQEKNEEAKANDLHPNVAKIIEVYDIND